jgi:hypothetical protein
VCYLFKVGGKVILYGITLERYLENDSKQRLKAKGASMKKSGK